jgi:hypothetical protein
MNKDVHPPLPALQSGNPCCLPIVPHLKQLNHLRTVDSALPTSANHGGHNSSARSGDTTPYYQGMCAAAYLLCRVQSDPLLYRETAHLASPQATAPAGG